MRLSPKNGQYPSVEVLHFKKEKANNRSSGKLPPKNKSETKSNISIPSVRTLIADNGDLNNPLIPKKLSFNSSISTETPEKRLETLKSQMNGFLHKLKSNEVISTRYEPNANNDSISTSQFLR